MAPNQNRKTTRACKELQPFGISADEVREALKELLNLYEHNWKFIEDDNYKVLHDFILDKKQEKEKSVKSIEKELCLRDESEDDEIPLAVQNVRNNKRKASTSVDNSNLRVVKSPLGKAQQESQTMSRPFSPARNLSKKHREPDCQILQDTQITNFCSSYKKARPKSVSAQGKGKTLVILQAVPKKRGSKSERGTEIVNAEGQAVENCSELVTMNVLDRFYGDDSLDIPRDELLNQPQDEVPLAVEYLVVPDQRIKMACKALKPFGFSGGEVKEVLKRLLELYDNNWVFIEDENYKILLDHLLQEKKDVHSVKRFCDGLEDAEELETPPKIQQYQTHKKRLASSSLTGSNEQVEKDYKVRKKTPATPHADSRVRELNCEVGIGDVFIGGSGVEDCRNLVVAESVPDKCHSDSLDMTYGNQPGQALDEVPLVVILPDPPSQLDEDGSSERNSSSKIKEFLEPISSEGKNKVAVILSNEDGSSNGNVSDGKADFGLVETRLPYVNDSFPKASQFDIASTSNGEVKISLICSPFQNDFQFPCLDTVVKMVEDKWLKSKRTMETSLIEKLMKELCDCFLILGSASADGQHVGSTSATLETSKQSDAQDIHCGKEDHNFSHSILPDLSWRSIRVQNLVEVLLPIPKGVVLNGLSDLRFVTGLNIKDLNISRYSEKMMKVLTVGRQSSYPVQVHCSSYDAVKSYNYIDDITRGEERVKISLVSDCTGEALPNFSYIPQNTVYRKAVVNFALACIPHEGCCSDCFKDCLSSASPCVCAQKPGGGFSYKSGGLVNEEFLEECICMNQDPKALHYFYCKKCPIGSSEERDSSDPCEGHLSRKFLKECWAKCGCSKSCGNRVVQRGITANLQVFLTSKDKGWGLRTLEDLPKGAFICEYVGEVVTKSELHERNIKKTGNDQKLTYSVVLDAAWNSHDVLKDDDVLYLDATVYGNVARFINHRCSDATLIAIPVEMESPNRRYYHLGFFTTRNIKAMEELTWDYGINFNDTQSAFKCVCGSRYCRGRIGKHSKLLESFEKSYPDLQFPPLPERDDFDLKDVLESPYFFN